MDGIIDTYIQDYDPLIIDLSGDIDTSENLTEFHTSIVSLMQQLLANAVVFKGVDHTTSYNTRRVHYIFHTTTSLKKELVQDALTKVERLFKTGTGLHMLKTINFKSYNIQHDGLNVTYGKQMETP